MNINPASHGFARKSLKIMAGVVASSALATSAMAATDMVCTAIPNSTSLLCTPAAVAAAPNATAVQIAQAGGGHMLVGAAIGGLVGVLLGGIQLPDNGPPGGGARIILGLIGAGIGAAIGSVC